MTGNRPTTFDEYILAAPPEGQPHLRQLNAFLKSDAPEAEEVTKWGTPFFVEPRFVFSFSAHKAHCNFAPSTESLDAFRDELAGYKTTKNYLQIPFSESVPEDLVRKIAEFRLQVVRERDDDDFW